MSVKLYSTPSCAYCNMIKNYFNERHVKYTEYNVENDSKKLEELVHKTRQTSVPVVDFDGSIILGFDRNRLDRLINNAKRG